MKCSVKKEKCPYGRKSKDREKCLDYRWVGFGKCHKELPKCAWCKKEIDDEKDLEYRVFEPRELPFPHEIKVALCSTCYKKLKER